MTDPTTPVYGLGAIPSPPDDRDWSIDMLYAMAGLEPLDVAAAPPTFIIPGKLPPVIDQGTSPMCVAFSQSTLKAYEDLKDTGPANFDEALFFRQIGGNAAGAVTRVGLNRLVNYGYPLVGNSGAASSHKLAAYYSVPVTEAAIKSALVRFGILTFTTPWYEEWFRTVHGVLPAGHILAGHHETDAIGYDSRGLMCQQSWGLNYGENGRFWMPWATVVARVQEVWKTVDQIVKPPPGATYRVTIGAHAVVQIATLKGSCISKWTKRPWGPEASSAPCRPPEVRKGCSSGQATVVYVTKGVFEGQRIRIAAGVTAAKS